MHSATFLKLALTSLAASCLASAIPPPTNTQILPAEPSFPIHLPGVHIRDTSADSLGTCANIKDWVPSQPECILGTTNAETQIINARDLDLAKRMVTQNFISPHTKRVFKVALASSIVSSANWFFDLWIRDFSNGVSLWRGGVAASTNLELADVTCLSMIGIYSSATQYRGSAEFQVSGGVGKGGASELVIKFTAEIFASAAETYIGRMIVDPSATLAGASIDISSWSFDIQK
jgi:hypothetical protein